MPWTVRCHCFPFLRIDFLLVYARICVFCMTNCMMNVFCEWQLVLKWLDSKVLWFDGLNMRQLLAWFYFGYDWMIWKTFEWFSWFLLPWLRCLLFLLSFSAFWTMCIGLKDRSFMVSFYIRCYWFKWHFAMSWLDFALPLL